MKVNIQYAVDVGDVPKEVAKLLPKYLDLTPEVATIEEALYNGNVVNAMEMVDHLRTSLYAADSRLQDCSALLKGFLGVKGESGQSPELSKEGGEDDSAS